MKVLKCFSFIVIIGLIILAAGYIQGITSQASPQSFDPKAIDVFIAEQLKVKGLVGLSVAVVQEGRIVFANVYGKSSLDSGQPVKKDTRFSIGSVTKQFTSACILLLAEDGKLSVTDKVAKYYPDLTQANDISLLDLMNHVSGYPDYYPLDFVVRSMRKPIAVDEVLRQSATGKLDFEPGTLYSYSNTGYLILGRIVEKVSGEPFGEFISHRILKPLGMNHTVYGANPGSPGIAEGYTTFALSPPELAVYEGKGWVAAAGGLYSTGSDLAKWDLSLIEGKVLNPESYKLMTTSRKLADGRLTDYGCGLHVWERNSETVLSHAGACNGFFALNTIIPSRKAAVIILSNFATRGVLDSINRQILGTLLPAVPPAGQVQAPKKESPYEPDLPKIAGPSALNETKAFFRRLQTATVDRSELGEEFSYFLTDSKIQGAAARLKTFGNPTSVEVTSIHERGGMEVSRCQLKFQSGVLLTLMYRTPDGKIQQFLVSRD